MITAFCLSVKNVLAHEIVCLLNPPLADSLSPGENDSPLSLGGGEGQGEGALP